jgi:hypothetical protein
MKHIGRQMGGLLAIVISGWCLFVTLQNPDLVGFRDDWPVFLTLLAVIGLLFIWGLSLLRPSLDILREIWEGIAERFEKEVDLSDVEVPPVDESTE